MIARMVQQNRLLEMAGGIPNGGQNTSTKPSSKPTYKENLLSALNGIQRKKFEVRARSRAHSLSYTLNLPPHTHTLHLPTQRELRKLNATADWTLPRPRTRADAPAI